MLLQARTLTDLEDTLREDIFSNNFTRRPPIMSARIAEIEQLITLASERMGAELVSLEQFSEAFAKSEAGQLQPFVAAHRRGAVAVLYHRLQSLMRHSQQLKLLSRFASRFYSDRVDVGVPPELLPPSLDVTVPEALGVPHRPSDDYDATPAGAPAGLRQRKVLLATANRHHSAMTGSAALRDSIDNAASSSQTVAMVAAVQDTIDARKVEQQMAEVSSMLSLISEKLLDQQEDIQSVLDDAIQARTHVTDGSKELKKATERPHSLRDFVVTLLLILTGALWFLEWYSR